ncbi:hypothetical protein GH5_02072 [Leishmania sp. Ghana 2012 LV757]|uniref:hypothetical protein n=1 Tax=Leishmania sp. Ghana 2012 LV757 TaxID=2803181 RepID=UPI001B74AE7C|nr:hypothetical protein GH5_02072 [Leishmania sp. Ghana 2012 LV757]
MSVVMHSQQRRPRLRLTCACLIVLLSVSLSSSPTLVTAQDELVRDGVVSLPEGMQRAELELAVPVLAAEHVDTAGPSERPREAIVEVSVEVPLDDVAVSERGVSDAQQVNADAAASVSEERRVIETSRTTKEIRNTDEMQRVAQVEQEEVALQAEGTHRTEDGEGEKTHMAAEAQNTVEDAPELRAVTAERLVGGEMREEVLPSSVHPPTEENAAQPPVNDTLHVVDLAQDAAAHHSGQSLPPLNPMREADFSFSSAAVTPNTNPSTGEESGTRMEKEDQKAEESRFAEEVRQMENNHRREEMHKTAEEGRRSQEMQAAQELETSERSRSAQEAARQAESARPAEAVRQADMARAVEEVARQSEAAGQAEEAREGAAVETAFLAGKLQKAEEEKLPEEQHEEVQPAEEARPAEESRRTQERRLAAEAHKAEEEEGRAEVTRRAEEKRQADVAAEKAAQLRKAAAETQGRLTAQRKAVLAKIDEEKAQFQAATADLTAQQEETSASQRDKAAVSELQNSMGKRLSSLQQDLLTLERISVTLRGRVSSLLRGDKPLAQVQEDVQALDGEVKKARETLDKILEAANLLTDAARAAVESHKNALAVASEKRTLLAEQKRVLAAAHDDAIQQRLALLQILDTQLAEAAKQPETQEAAFAEPAKTGESTATPPSPVTPATAEGPQGVASSSSKTPQPAVIPTLVPALSTLEAEAPVMPPKSTGESRTRYRGELIDTMAKQAEEKGYGENSNDARLSEDGVPYKVNGHMQAIGTVVAITIAATVQTLRWCRNGCHSDEEDEESDETVKPGCQASETSSLSPRNPFPQSSGPSPQRPQAAPPSTSPPRGANAGPYRGDGGPPSRWESGSMTPSSQGGTTSATSEQMRLPGEKNHFLLPGPVGRDRLDAFPPGAPVTGGPRVTRGPSHGDSSLDAARALPPPLGIKSPFTPPRNVAPGKYPSPMHPQLPLTGGQFVGPPPPQLPGYRPMAGTTPQMHRRRNDSDDFELHNPFLSRWS